MSIYFIIIIFNCKIQFRFNSNSFSFSPNAAFELADFDFAAFDVADFDFAEFEFITLIYGSEAFVHS